MLFQMFLQFLCLSLLFGTSESFFSFSQRVNAEKKSHFQLPSAVYYVTTKQSRRVSKAELLLKKAWTEADKIINLPAGQLHGDRTSLQEKGSVRDLVDPQMWTHIFLFISGIYAFQKTMYDLSFLVGLTTVLSGMYHHTYERPGLLAKVEGISAKLLCLYGTLQIFQAPSIELVVIELLMLLVTIGIYVVTNLNKDLYDPYHCLLHVVPVIWSCVGATYHKPLLVLF
jgi:hypothetical protein